MKIYTKNGDGGETSVLGKCCSKCCLEIEAIGEVDELNGYVGLIFSKLDGEKNASEKKALRAVQNNLFVIGSNIAGVQMELDSIPRLNEYDVVQLENIIDEMESGLPELQNFILPCGGEIATLCFVARAICRRGERAVVKLKEKHADLDPRVQKYLNRLGDYLFVLARWLNKREGAEEVAWKGR